MRGSEMIENNEQYESLLKEFESFFDMEEVRKLTDEEGKRFTELSDELGVYEDKTWPI